MAPRDSGLAGTATATARVRGLTRAFDGRAVLDGVDLDCAPWPDWTGRSPAN
jgi:hypothetical protein